MTEENSKDKEPRKKQLAFAQFLCGKKGLKLPTEVLLSSKKLFDWLKKNLEKAKKN